MEEDGVFFHSEPARVTQRNDPMNLQINRVPVLLSCAVALLCTGSLEGADRFGLVKDDVVVLAGGTNMVRLQQAGYLETALTRAFASARPRFRDLAWEADTVFGLGTVIERWRPDGFGNRDEQFRRVGTTVVIEEQQQPTGILRSISQGLGSLWFNIQQVVGTETELTTPTAVAAIRGTEGSQFVPKAMTLDRKELALLYVKEVVVS